MRCHVCGNDSSLCDHTSIYRPVPSLSEDETVIFSVSLDSSEEDVQEITSEELEPVDDETLYLNPELPSISLSKTEAVNEARARVLEKISKMDGHAVVKEAILGMMRSELLGMSLEGVEFPEFHYDVELPLRGLVFSVRLLEEVSND